MKLTADEYEKAKNGVYKGFSIEAMFDGFDQLEANAQLSADENLIQTIKELLNEY